MTRLTRAYVADLEVASDGRTITGIAVPYGQPARVRDSARGPAYDESFVMGAFRRTIAERGDRVKLLVNHDRQSLPIGRAVELHEDPAGLIGSFRVSATRAGDEALELVRDGALDSFSVSFDPVSHTGDYTRGITRTEVKLSEVSAVSFPAYEGARILAVRSEHTAALTIARHRLELARAAAAPYIDKD